ncbi:HNH endonuclease [Lysinibacillus antri]|uniref:Uncharacterized protein n=1 Tax=Lysinibacillus antri TaxID=2498145 RepID=A0A3S0R3S5_9BACI|nr:HNH endonuclease [Lysinibacillus antri]RUL47232.1 hypothetical protein EK386_18765 [Lysinibacillus antri]
MTKITQTDYKKQFIEANYSNENSIQTTKYQLSKLHPYEKQLHRDLFNMDEAELLIGLRAIGKDFSSSTTASGVISTVYNYIEWARLEGIHDNPNPLEGINKTELAQKMVDDSKRIRYTREQLFEMLEKLPNYTDQAILLALFEGMKGREFTEIFSLTLDHLQRVTTGNSVNYIATLENIDKGVIISRKIFISEELYHLLHKADSQERLLNDNGKGGFPFHLESSYIFKKVKRGKQENYLAMQERHYITRRFLKFKKLFENPELEADDIFYSGMMDMAYQLSIQHGDVSKDHYYMLHKQFNTRLAYGNNGYSYPNTTFLRTEVYNAKFHTLYDHLIEKNRLTTPRPLIIPSLYLETYTNEYLQDEDINNVNVTEDGYVLEQTIKRHSRLDAVKLVALEKANYECNVNSEHKDFISKSTGKNYVEVHHLIPLKYQKLFKVNIDTEANVVALCAGCHRHLHYGEFEGKIDILHKLFKVRKQALRKAGILVTFKELLSYYEKDFDEELTFVNE